MLKRQYRWVNSIEEVDNFKYLGARIQSEGDVSKEIKSRLTAYGFASIEWYEEVTAGSG